MKIYIIGPTGAGKTTLSKKMSVKYNIKAYELDCLVYDDKNNHTKRSNEEINKLLDNILVKDSWIIEDVGRNKFSKCLEYCDVIYYLNIPKYIVYMRVIKRWVKQRFGREAYNYPPTLHQFLDSIAVVRLYYKHEKDKLERINKYNNKVKYLSNKDLNKI